MKQFENEDGLAFTASSADSVAGFARFTSAYMGFRRDTGAILNSIVETDPDMPMARCTKGYLAKLISSSNHSARARKISAELFDSMQQTGANDRERQHAAALSAWCAEDMDKATGIWEDILLTDPNDGLAIRLAHFTHLYSGDPRRIRDSLARILPLWSPNHRDYGFLLGAYAYGLEECGEYAKAERFGRRAVERNPKDAWSVHSVAHVMEMTERHEEGIAWVTGHEESWSSVNNFRFHLYWHRCLFHLERGEFDTVLSIYDEQIVSDINSEFYLDKCNATSLLWRLEMFGIDVGSRWKDLLDVARPHINDTELIFVSLHYLMALIAGGDMDAADRMISNIREWSTLDGTQARVCAECGLAIAEGLKLVRQGKFDQALATMMPVRYKLDSIGGSLAQLDVFHMILLDAAKSSQNTIRARSLIAERLGQKVHSTWTWNSYGDVLEIMGQSDQAREARNQAATLISL